MAFREPTPVEIDAQIEWEGENITAGIERYRLSLTKVKRHRDGTTSRVAADMGDTAPGMRIALDMMPKIVAAIEAAREEAIEGIGTSGRGRPADWWWTLTTLPPDALAAIAVRTLLSSRHNNREATSNLTATTAALLIGGAVRDEVEFQQWRADSKRRAKEEGELDLAALLIGRFRGHVCRRTFQRWRKKCSDIVRLDWTREEKLQLGMKLLVITIENGGGWFTMQTAHSRGRTVRVVALSDDARAAITNLNAKLEVTRPYLLPMTCPPKPWRRTIELPTNPEQQVTPAG